jgi:hypothetical protein
VTTHKRKRRNRRRPRATAPQVPPRPPKPSLVDRPERLDAPWSPFPLVELCVLVGIVCIVVGLITGRYLVLACGVVLGALGGLDTSAREHFAGYRSHTLVLAGVPAVLLAALAAFAKAPLYAVVAVLVIVFGVAAYTVRRAWEKA